MKKFSTLLFILLSHFCFSQNLVLNWSFEDTVLCPNYYDEINRSAGWSAYSESPDYFNSCSSLMGIPMNDIGFQYAKTGNAYAGFISFSKYTSNYREALGTRLSEPLVISQKYYVSFYVSRAFDRANPSYNAIHANAASNKIGARFSTVQYFSDNTGNTVPVDNHPQIFSDSVITDTLNWVKISGSFIADSAYQYVCFGNFFADSATTYISFDTIAAFAYYYIDDIIVSTDSLYIGLNNISYPFPLIKIIPNPARDWIAVEGSDLKSFSIFDISGRRCIEDAFAATSLKSIYIGKLSKGIYFVHVNTSNQSSVQKLIIQ